ncbi:hypothetical protein KTJ89_06780 [Brevibacterium sediminis]|uniref:phosphopantetheine-binding protein n=1 Tax=Brevibacterium sediminis TaxID=1857024 RepID=UPI0021756710|nr:phosphopantetheine-binding protein [Brevibacterium sediminis]MCS4592688.1 hypothetical protein [Brevibacterium sediminis]
MRNDTKVANIVYSAWMEHVTVIGDRPSDFFADGGDSLRAARLCNRISAQLSLELPIYVIFEHPNFKDFVATVERLLNTSSEEPTFGD